MPCDWRKFLTFASSIFILTAAQLVLGQGVHEHPAPSRLGVVSFPTSCQPAVQADFDRAVALLHSFSYVPAHDAFRGVTQKDPSCCHGVLGPGDDELPPALATAASGLRESCAGTSEA